jgi:hypothetical protein
LGLFHHGFHLQTTSGWKLRHKEGFMSGTAEESEKMGRRALLKAIAATGGAVAAASMLPGKWVKPVIEAGVLPAHAQASPPVQTINIWGLTVDWGGQYYIGTFNFFDPLGGVNGATLLFALQLEGCQQPYTTTCSLAQSGQTLTQWGAVITYLTGNLGGTITFHFQLCGQLTNCTRIGVRIQVGSRQSILIFSDIIPT